ncbi:MAG: ribosome maturation factor [Sphingomonadaceae bacterium]
MIEPVVAAAGFALVRVHLTGGRDLTLQVMAEDPLTGQMTLDQCAALSRRLSELLEASDPIPGAYRLEVSSPGIDRPLTRLDDFARFVPHVARVELVHGVPIGGAMRKRFQGPLKGTDGTYVLIEAEGIGRVRLPFADIRNAKLLLTDALIKATAPISSEGADVLVEEAADGRRKTVKSLTGESE